MIGRRFLTVPGLPQPREGELPADEPTLAEKIEAAQHRINAAYSALRGARVCYEHSPNGDNEKARDKCEAAFNARLDEYIALQKLEEAAC